MRISAACVSAFACALVIALSVRPLLAAADHIGRVTLSNGVPVPGARVTATQGETTVATTTDVQGGYRFPALAEGAWTIQVAMVGFSPQRRDVVVASGAAATTWELSVLPFAEITRGVPMPPPAPPPDLTRRTAPQRPEGRGSGPRGDTGNGPAQPAGSFQRAGVAPGPPERLDGVPSAPPAGSSPAAAAAAAAAAKIAAGRGIAPPLEPPPGDAVGDAFLVSGTVNTGAAQPSVGTAARPTGIRLFRGQVTLDGASSAWDARPYSMTGLAVPRPDTSRLNISGLFQGPIRIPGLMRVNRNLLLQYNRNVNNSANTMSERMPTLLQRRGDFSQTLDGFGNPVRLVDPVTGVPFEGNVIGPERISPQAAALLAYYPPPQTDATNTFNYQIPAYNSSVTNSVNASIANIVNNTTNLIGVNGNYSRSSNESTSLFGFDDSSGGSGMNVAMTWTRRFIPSNQQLRMRHTYTRQTNTSEPYFANDINVSGEAGITGNNQDPENWGPPRLSFASQIAGLSSGQYSFSRTTSHAFNVETPRTIGRHTFVVGGNVRLQTIDQVSQQNARGSFTFNGSFTGHDFADFLLGLPNTSSIAYGNADKGFRAWTYDAYVNDDFRVSPNVTINFGIRWDFEAPVTERFDRLVNLDVADDFSAAAPVVADDRLGPITGRRYPSSLIKADPWGIQPRVGVAWRPIPTSSVILRAGYGISRNTSVYQTLAQQMAQQPPLSFAFNSVSTPATPLTLANGFIAPVSTTLNTSAFDPDFRVGTVHRWQASAQRDLPGGHTAVATYLAGKGVDLPQAFIPNTYPAGAVNPCPACPTGFVYNTSGASSLQNAGQFELRRRLRSGLQWTATYTLTKADDNASSFGGPGGSIAQNWLDLEAERGPSSFEQRHQFRFNVAYNTGQGIGGGALRTGLRGRLLNGWSMNSNLTAGSGTPRTPVYRVTSVAGVTGTVRASLTGASIDDAPEGYYANPLAFAPPSSGTWGDAPRNSIRGPAQFSLNANLSRSFPVGNRFSLNWSLSANNVLNRVTYSTIDTTVGSPRFGLPVSTSGMRRISTRLNVGF
jgi:hypothetical protein